MAYKTTGTSSVEGVQRPRTATLEITSARAMARLAMRVERLLARWFATGRTCTCREELWSEFVDWRDERKVLDK